jgi:hypothetical protein
MRIQKEEGPSGIGEFYKSFDKECENWGKMSEYKYSQYVVRIDNGEYIGGNYTYVLLLNDKGGAQSHEVCKSLNDIAKSMRKKKIRFVEVDKLYNDVLQLTLDKRLFPHLYVINNGTVYSWDKQEQPTAELVEPWLLDLEYKKSVFQFPAPRVISDEEEFIKKK